MAQRSTWESREVHGDCQKMSQSCVAVVWLEDSVDEDGQGVQAWRDAAWMRQGDGR